MSDKKKNDEKTLLLQVALYGTIALFAIILLCISLNAWGNH